SAGEDQVLGPVLGGPARDAGTERSAATGDQNRATRLPGRTAAAARPGQSAREDTGRAYGHLVLTAGRRGGEYGPQVCGTAFVELLGQIDESAPAVGVLERGDLPQAPDLRL